MNEMQRKAFNRKILYIGLILGLFTLSLFWRGLIPIPFSDAERAQAAQPTWADRLNARTIVSQANNLELRELDVGDPSVAMSAAQVSMIGLRGPIVTGLWWAAIEKQKRNEWHEFEQLVRMVTQLQPNFVTPWIFQSWNIAYNVSVENDKLGDMYFYIARGIELLAEGDRKNTKTYRPLGKEPVKVGSPDIRYQLGFYYQNKFEVSDKVNTLRCLFQLSCIRPTERDTQMLLQDGQVNDGAFRAFCEKNPQLVRRLRTRLNCTTPKDVVDFLRNNTGVPSRYAAKSAVLLPAEAQFPILPPEFTPRSSVGIEHSADKEATDIFDAFHAARAWFEYAQIVVPPIESRDADASPTPNRYDLFRYRMPQRPALVIYRMAPSRAQSYLAQRLMKEGWFDSSTTWNPDEGVDKIAQWFTPAEEGHREARPLLLRTPSNAQTEWETAYKLWREYGELNGLREEDFVRYNQLSPLAIMFAPGELPRHPSEYSDDDIDAMFGRQDPSMTDEERRKRARDIIAARRSKVLYEQNLRITNFPFFLAQSQAEHSRYMVEARKKQYEASTYTGLANRRRALNAQIEACVRWRQACLEFRSGFHSNDQIQEQLFEVENEVVKMLRDDALFRRRMDAVRLSLLALKMPEAEIAELPQLFAEKEAQLRIAYKFGDREFAARAQERSELLAAAAGGASMVHEEEDAPNAIERELLNREFAWMLDFTNRTDRIYWIKPIVREGVKQRLGLSKPPEPPPGVPGPGGPAGPGPGGPAGLPPNPR